MKQVVARVRGRVQMVMFRDFTKRHAEKRGITGFVKNMPDGSVYVCAEGEESMLSEFLSDLKKGSFLSRVDTVEESWGEATKTFSDFQIHYYG